MKWLVSPKRKGRSGQPKFAVLALFVVQYVNKIKNGKNIHKEIIFENGWDTVYNGEKLGVIRLGDERLPLANRGDVFTFESVIPSGLQKHPVFIFRTVHADITVMIDGNVVYSYGQQDTNEGKLVGYGYHYIPLSKEDEGKIINITSRVSENYAFSSLDTPFIVDADYYQRDFMIRNSFRLSIILFLIVFGIIFLIIVALTWKKSIDSQRLFSVAVFTLAIGIWSLCTTDTIRMFTYDLKIKSILEFVSLYIAPACVFGYFYQEIKNESRIRYFIYIGIELSLVLFIVVSISLQILNIVHLPAVLRILHMLVAAAILFIIVRCFIDIKKGVFKDSLLIYGIVILSIFVLADMIKFNVKKYSMVSVSDHYDSTIYVGMFIFILTLILDYCEKSIKRFYQQIEEEMLRKLAYNDELTGLANRYRMEEVMDSIDENKDEFLVINFDLNNLKTVNDTMGHIAGDIYIKTFGSILLDTFGDVATVSRTGGDEFAVVISKIADMNSSLDDMLNEMNQKITQANVEHENWDMSVAYGVARYDESDCDDVRRAFKVADNRMYEMKKNMKSTR